MSRVYVISSSFLAGACFATVVQNNHQGRVAAQSITSITMDTNGKASTAFLFDVDAVPHVKPLDSRYIVRESTIRNAPNQQLDGVTCIDCTFENAVLTYGGGSFNLDRSFLSGKTKLELTGAAANTYALLELLKGIKVDRIETSMPLNRNIVQIVVPTKRLPLHHFVSPFGQTTIGPDKP